jgi:hypothetical protein
MKITITIDERGAAFESGHETQRILTQFALTFGRYLSGEKNSLMDYNGNVVGTVEIDTEG